jgi:hypothetical protein
MVAMIAGCSAVLGIEDLRPPTIHGTVRDMTADTVSSVSIVFRDPLGPPIGEATTDGKGRFEIPITAALPLTGYLDLDDPNFVHTFSHLSQPVVDHNDLDVEVLTLTAAGLRTLASDVHVTQDPARSLVIAQVVDAGGSALEGATVLATGVSQICYTDPSTGSPCVNGATDVTRGDGKAWLFDVPATLPLKITAMDADGKPHSVMVAVGTGPSLVFTPVPPAS